MLFIKNPRFISLLSLSISSLFLAACGGAGDNKTTINTPVSEPIQIGSSSWKKALPLSRQAVSLTSKVEKDRMDFSLKGLNITSNKHWQIHIDIDNDPKTGFQFTDEAWTNKSGVDYIIEDGFLYKSTANDSSWSWSSLGKISVSSVSNNEIKVSFAITNRGLCKKFNVGAIGLDANWSIDTFYPTASSLLKQQTTFCDKPTPNNPPVITLIGDSPITIPLNSTYTDLGATATDVEDGVLTPKIKVDHINLNTAVPGKFYSIRYKVTDSNGATVYKTRKVIVDSKTSGTGIIVDGKNSEWATINSLALDHNGTIKVTDDKDFIFIMVDSNNLGANRQIYIDTDNSLSTGYLISGAADYLIENEDLSKFIGNNQDQWAWKYNSAPIVSSKRANVLEIAIPKSALHNLGNTPAFSFHSVDSAWNAQYMLPNTLFKYSLKVPVPNPNKAPIAVNDIASTLNTASVTVNVLNNDTDPDNDTLTITKVTKPANGTATIVGNKIKYDPATNFRGNNTVTYTISDGHGHTATATLKIVVTGINRVPNAVEDAPSTNHTVPVLINILQNDTDPDGDTLTVLSITQPAFGTATLNANGTVLFDPKGHVGSHAFSYIISDGHGGTDTAVVTIATSNPNNGQHGSYPHIHNENVTTPKNTAIFINVLANDSDPDGDALILDQVDYGDHGTTKKVNGGVLYTPNPGYSGTDLFYYGVHDGHGHNGAGIVRITITQ